MVTSPISGNTRHFVRCFCWDTCAVTSQYIILFVEVRVHNIAFKFLQADQQLPCGYGTVSFIYCCVRSIPLLNPTLEYTNSFTPSRSLVSVLILYSHYRQSFHSCSSTKFAVNFSSLLSNHTFRLFSYQLTGLFNPKSDRLHLSINITFQPAVRNLEASPESFSRFRNPSS
jgi:hypothetical protein